MAAALFSLLGSDCLGNRGGGDIERGGIEGRPQADDDDEIPSRGPDSDGDSVNSISQPSIIIRPIDDAEQLDRIDTLTSELLSEWENLDNDSQIRPWRWIELWELFLELQVDPERVPINVAPQWLIAATESNQLAGCAAKWQDFFQEMNTQLDAGLDERVRPPSEDFVEAASESFNLWLLEYVGNSETNAAALDCDE